MDAQEKEFDKADQILSEALQRFQAAKVSQYVWGMALVEVGVSALVKLDEDEKTLLETVKRFIEREKVANLTS